MPRPRKIVKTEKNIVINDIIENNENKLNTKIDSIVIETDKCNEHTENNNNNGDNQTNTIIKKRRGRQPKKIEAETNKIIKPTRRGRKPKNKFKTEENLEVHHMNLISNVDDNLIIKLPLECLDDNKEYINNIETNFFEFNSVNDNINNNIINNNIINNNNNNNLYNNNNNSNNLESNNNFDNNEHNVKNIINNNFNRCDNFDKDNLSILNNENENENLYLNSYNNFTKNLYNNENKKKLKQIEILLNKKYRQINSINLLNNYCRCLNNDNWIQKTDIACFWCCHQFDYTPWGIPQKYENNRFKLFGIFCTPNCALSYLINNESNNNKRWEMISLLNLLYYKVYNSFDDLVPAPDKIILKLFGGPFCIEEFRAFTLSNDKNYNICLPPSYIIIPTLEESNKNFLQNNTFNPKNNDNKETKNELKLKRIHSVYKDKNTLDKCMGIKYI